mgnify:CR=1 FL=1
MWDWKWTADFLTHWNHLFLICQNGKIYYFNYNTVWRKWQQNKQADIIKIKREPLSTRLQALTPTLDGRLIVSVDGVDDDPSTKSEEKTAEVDGQNRLYEILERELQAKNL